MQSVLQQPWTVNSLVECLNRLHVARVHRMHSGVRLVVIIALVARRIALARPIFIVRVSVVIALVAITRLIIVISSTAIRVSATVVSVVTTISHHITIVVAACSVVISVNLWITGVGVVVIWHEARGACPGVVSAGAVVVSNDSRFTRVLHRRQVGASDCIVVVAAVRVVVVAVVYGAYRARSPVLAVAAIARTVTWAFGVEGLAGEEFGLLVHFLRLFHHIVRVGVAVDSHKWSRLICEHILHTWKNTLSTGLLRNSVRE